MGIIWFLGVALGGASFASAQDGSDGANHDSVVRDYYLQNRAQFDVVEAQHIAILRIERDSGKPLPEPQMERQEQRARKVLAQALGGVSFDELVHEWSEDLSSIEAKGRFRFHRHTMMPAFDDWCFSAGVGEIGWVVTEHAFHIVRLHWRSEFPDVRELVEQYLADEGQPGGPQP